MADETYIPEYRALLILCNDGDFSESQARIVLGHSRKQAFDGATYYPMSYIYKRASDNAARPEA